MFGRQFLVDFFGGNSKSPDDKITENTWLEWPRTSLSGDVTMREDEQPKVKDRATQLMDTEMARIKLFLYYHE